MNKPITFQKATADMLPHLKALWLCCFPDDRPEDVDAFYQSLFMQTECLVGVIDGCPVTMLHLLPAIAYVDGAAYAVRYLYAGGTHPSHRHCGYYAALMRYAEECVLEMGECGIYLHPAHPQLVALYEQAGYQMCIHSSLPVEMDAGMSIEQLSASTFAQLRHARIQSLKTEYVYFEPAAPVSAMFIEGLFREGTCLYSGFDMVQMGKEGLIYHPLPPSTNSKATAMWLPVGESRVVSKAIREHGGMTALLGE